MTTTIIIVSMKAGGIFRTTENPLIHVIRVQGAAERDGILLTSLSPPSSPPQ